MSEDFTSASVSSWSSTPTNTAGDKLLRAGVLYKPLHGDYPPPGPIPVCMPFRQVRYPLNTLLQIAKKGNPSCSFMLI